MEKETEVKDEGQAQESVFYTWKNRSFKSQAELDSFLEGLAFSQGRAAQAADAMAKELAPFKKLGAKVQTPDQAEVAKRVVALLDEGKAEEAVRAQFEYIDALTTAQARKEAEENFWRDYVKSRKDIFEVLDEDMSKDYVFRNYHDQLYQEEDAFGFLDRVLKPKASKFVSPKPKASEDDVLSPIGKGKSVAPAREPEKKEPEASMDSVLSKLGFR